MTDRDHLSADQRCIWLYIHSEPGLWTVGFYDPNGKWQPESDHDTSGDAANRVNFLNGGNGHD